MLSQIKFIVAILLIHNLSKTFHYSFKLFFSYFFQYFPFLNMINIQSNLCILKLSCEKFNKLTLFFYYLVK